MPAIVIGADTALGEVVVAALTANRGEVRAFVSDPSVAKRLRDGGVKVAVGDVSDGSHIAGAAAGCFSAVVIPEAAFDARERSFSASPAETITAWASALTDASLTRVIWLEDHRVAGASRGFERSISEVAVIATNGRTAAEIATEAARLDDLDSLGEV